MPVARNANRPGDVSLMRCPFRSAPASAAGAETRRYDLFASCPATEGRSRCTPAQPAEGLSPSAAECLEQALKRRSLGRALRSEIDGQQAAVTIRQFLGVLT
jgi:hypothetical protein